MKILWSTLARVCAVVVLYALPCQAQVSLLNDTVDHSDRGVPPNHRVAPKHTKDDAAYVFVPVETEPVAKTDVRTFLVYPQLAIKQHIEGRVYMRFNVRADGTVGNVIVEKCDHGILKQAAVDAVKQIRFTPAIQNGLPVAVWTSMTVEFSLKKEVPPVAP